jgi:acetyltransferase-like isoleucine patch superfamily enzyme
LARRSERTEPILRGARNRLLQVLALYAPGSRTVRPWLHRRRGVSVGRDVFIGTDAIIETARPELVTIGDDVEIGIRAVLMAHHRDMSHSGARRALTIEDHAFIGPGVIVLPGVTIGRGAVVMAGSVVTRSIPPLTMVQGNPAVPVAKCGVPLGANTPLGEFYRALRPIRRGSESGS